MNRALFRSTLKSNWILILIFSVISLFYLILIISIYNSENLKNMEAALTMIPAEITATIGMDTIPTSLTDFIASYFYDFLIQLFLVIHVIILPVRLVVRYVDSGSMSYLLSTPNSRIKIIITKAFYMAASLAVMIIIMTVSAMIYSASSHPDALDIPAFLSLNFTTYLVAMAMASISFFFSCLWNNVKYAAGCSTAILTAFFVFTLIGKYGRHKGIYTIVEYFSIFQLLKSREIVAGNTNMLLNNGLLICITAFFIGVGLLIFKKKDLPL
jgi:ABC-2 type transport system permease protein